MLELEELFTLSIHWFQSIVPRYFTDLSSLIVRYARTWKYIKFGGEHTQGKCVYVIYQ